MKKLLKSIYNAVFTPVSSLMVINGEYYKPMSTKRYSLNNPAISFDKYMLLCDEQKR